METLRRSPCSRSERDRRAIQRGGRRGRSIHPEKIPGSAAAGEDLAGQQEPARNRRQIRQQATQPENGHTREPSRPTRRPGGESIRKEAQSGSSAAGGAPPGQQSRETDPAAGEEPKRQQAEKIRKGSRPGNHPDTGGGSQGESQHGSRRGDHKRQHRQQAPEKRRKYAIKVQVG